MDNSKKTARKESLYGLFLYRTYSIFRVFMLVFASSKRRKIEAKPSSSITLFYC